MKIKGKDLQVKVARNVEEKKLLRNSAAVTFGNKILIAEQYAYIESSEESDKRTSLYKEVV